MSGKFDGILLATDIDGTLANFNEIPQRNIEAIQHFVKEGGMFTVCTGRGYAMTCDIVNQVPVNVPGICVNGMQLYDFQQRKVISEVYLSKEAEEILADMRKQFPDIGVMIVADNTYTIIEEGKYAVGDLRYRLDRFKSSGQYVDGTMEGLYPDWTKILFLVTGDRMREAQAYFEAHHSGRGIHVMITAPYFLEMIDAACDKGTGLKKLRTLLGAKVKRLVTVGDSYNDLSMFREADLSIAVQEAEPEVREKADLLAGPCMQGAVADAVELLEGGD